jgi:hypothetical protein
MAKLFDALKKLFDSGSHRSSSGSRTPRRDPQFVGRSSTKEIEEASPERVGELAGHAPERVET